MVQYVNGRPQNPQKCAAKVSHRKPVRRAGADVAGHRIESRFPGVHDALNIFYITQFSLCALPTPEAREGKERYIAGRSFNMYEPIFETDRQESVVPVVVRKSSAGWMCENSAAMGNDLRLIRYAEDFNNFKRVDCIENTTHRDAFHDFVLYLVTDKINLPTEMANDCIHALKPSVGIYFSNFNYKVYYILQLNSLIASPRFEEINVPN
ncbi:hypothetical protein ZHAS_00016473 [Anopheles sinensis]|uniref:Uncharacterized protein n=1 Tax=Anopheles sinensis TaxID=74873 RepID=A0A084WDR0_ANOSI|nr:hypothetical protein ZHAS_00016473 [Anopheles sinensis]